MHYIFKLAMLSTWQYTFSNKNITWIKPVNDKFLQFLSNDVSLYPSKLEDGFPRVFNNLLEHCESTHFNQYLNDLLFDKRGDRQGFPEDIVSELWKLQRYQQALESASTDQNNTDYWNWVQNKY